MNVVVAACALIFAGNTYGLANPLSDVPRPGRYLARRVMPAGASSLQSGAHQPLIPASENWKVPDADKPPGEVLEHWLKILPPDASLAVVSFHAQKPQRILKGLQDLRMIWHSAAPETAQETPATVQETHWRRYISRWMFQPSAKHEAVVRQVELGDEPNTYEPPASSGSSTILPSPGSSQPRRSPINKVELLLDPLNITKVFDFYATEVLFKILQPQWQSNYRKCSTGKSDMEKIMREVAGVTSIHLKSRITTPDLSLGWQFHANFEAHGCMLGIGPVDIMYYKPQNGRNEGKLLAIFPRNYPKDIYGRPTLNYDNYAKMVSGTSR